MYHAVTKWCNKIFKPTLPRHIRELNIHKKLGRPKDPTEDIEKELVNHALALESIFI